jgi:hypothetical protein
VQPNPEYAPAQDQQKTERAVDELRQSAQVYALDGSPYVEPRASANTQSTNYSSGLLPFQIDEPPSTGDIMSDPTREEFDAKLATVEARTETRFVELSGKVDRVGDAINALTLAVTTVRTEVKEDNKFTRWTFGVTLIASLIAFGAALWVTQGNMLSAFQAGLLLGKP